MRSVLSAVFLLDQTPHAQGILVAAWPTREALQAGRLKP